MYHGIKTALTLIGIALGAWLTMRLFLPLLFPFLLGGALALGAEPMTAFLSARLRLPRSAASGLGVTAAFCLLTLLILLLCALILRELAALMSILPSLEQSLSGGLSALSDWALRLASGIPGKLGNLAQSGIRDFFSGSSRLLEQSFRFVLGLTGGVLRQVPGSALVLGTAVISSYMISVRLPRIRSWIRSKVPNERIRRFWESVNRLKSALFGWLKAQLKLMGITFLVLTAGFLLLRVPNALLWAAVVALVDGFPILGTGTILLPWALVSFLQNNIPRALGLLSVYAVISLTRSILEPKLLGRQLGLDPLVTLASLYAGFRLWGFGGMILAPMLAVTAAQLIRRPAQET